MLKDTESKMLNQGIHIWQFEFEMFHQRELQLIQSMGGNVYNVEHRTVLNWSNQISHHRYWWGDKNKSIKQNVNYKSIK